jgi:magnesium transporter
MTLNRSQMEMLGKLLRYGALERAGKVLDRVDPAEVGELLGGFGPAEQKGLVDLLLSPRRASKTLRNVPDHVLRDLLGRVDDPRLASLLESVSTDDAVYFLELLPAERVSLVCECLEPERRELVQRALRYEPTAAGRLATTDFLAVSENASAQQAIELIRQHAELTESVSYLYVVDAEARLRGVVPFWRLVAARPERELYSLMDPDPLCLRATDDQEVAAALAARHGLLSVPVIDEEGRMVGVITVDDIMDVVQEEATEDFQKIGGSEALDAPYLETGLAQLIRKRAGWLVVLFLGGLLTATAMGYYEEAIAKAVVLSLFIPVIISSGGNSGSQASTLVIRAMALGEVRLKDWFRVVRRELLAGLALGTMLGGLGLLRIIFWPNHVALYGEHYLLVAYTVACSLVGIVLFGTIAGSMLPFVLRRAGLDPASASAPFVATLVDVTGLVIYFTIASLFLRGVLL